MHPLLADPFIAAQIEAAVAPYVGRLSEGEVAFMRDQLAEVLASNERAARLLRRARPVTVEESGEVRRDGGATVTPIAAAKRAKAGRRG
ncbi:MAG: hypothetical protein QM820_12045 [Minicystis sp.]